MTDTGEKSRLLIVESDPWRKECLSVFLTSHGFEVVAGAPEIILVNLCRRSGESADAVKELKTSWPAARIVAFVNELGAHTVFPCLVLGVSGIVAYDVSKKELLAALRTVLADSLWVPKELLAGWVESVVRQGVALTVPEGPDVFTAAEWRVLEGIARTLSNKEIARLSHVTESTVKFHVRKLLRKTGAKDRHALARIYRDAAAGGPPYAYGGPKGIVRS